MFNLKGAILLTVGNISAVKDELNFKTYVSQALKRYLKAGVVTNLKRKETHIVLRVNF
jgi:hypothetical protein